MKEWQERAHFGALDWASDHHDVVVVDRQGQVVASFGFAHTGEGWAEMRAQLAPYPQLAMAVETNQGAAVQQLIEAGLEIYPVNPKSAQRYRERKAPSGSKLTSSMAGAWPMRSGWTVTAGSLSSSRIRCSRSCACCAATRSR